MLEEILAKLATSIVVKSAGALLPDGNDRAAEKAFDEVVSELTIEASSLLHGHGEALGRVERLVLNEVLPQLQAIVEGLACLRAENTLESASATKVLGLLEEYVVEARRTRSDSRRDATMRALVGQFNEAAGGAGDRTVWWSLLRDLQDYEVEALYAIREQPILLIASSRELVQASIETATHAPLSTVPRIERRRAETLLAALERTCLKHGVSWPYGQGRERYQFRGELLKAQPGSISGQHVREYSLTEHGAAFMAFVKASPIGRPT